MVKKSAKKSTVIDSVIFLNPKTCGIYKNGGTRYKTDSETGLRTSEIDNELIEAVEAYLSGEKSPGEAVVDVKDVFRRKVLVPTYYDQRHDEPIQQLLQREKVEPITIGQLIDAKIIMVRNGHGSPGNDQRTGSIPYIKVSDIRALRVNVNPTNLVTESVAKKWWKGNESGLRAWDLITPNRASNNIGEFAVILPGEEQVVLTKEVFVIRVIEDDIYTPFYLLWVLSLKAVREQWHRIALMQTNREDCGDRHREVIIPKPPNKSWARKTSKAFTDYFSTLAGAQEEFDKLSRSDSFEYVASASPLPQFADVADAGANAGEVETEDEVK